MHEGGYGVRAGASQRFEFTRPDGRVIEEVANDSAEFFRDTDVETLNREQGLDIDAGTCVSLWDGTCMDDTMAMEALLHRDGALRLDPETRRYPAHFPPPRQLE